jgi:26S proteasome regulatory subunit N5
MALEKQTRTGADTHSTGRILVAIARLCFNAKDFKALNEHIVLLTKRRSQIKQAVTKLIQECCTFVDQIPDKDVMLELIDTLRKVTSGKIYVEVERARLTHRLAKIKEADGQVEEAATIMQELQVETYGSMDKREKVDLILEQMRLCLARKDFIRTQIISKKIHTKYFDSDESAEDLKLRYYELMIALDQNDASYLKICQHFRAILKSKSILSDAAKKLEVLKNVVIYAILSPYDNEQSDLLHRILEEKVLEEVPEYRDLLKLFSTPELIRWTFITQTYERILRQGSPQSPATAALGADPAGQKRWSDLKSRVVEHNIRIMSKYYSRVTLRRMSQLLDLTPQETEDTLSSLVVKKTVWAKVDRLEEIVSFSAYKDPSDVLNDWSHDISSLMQQICKVNHLINKEEMINQSLAAN